jgi:hypothetical protein
MKSNFGVFASVLFVMGFAVYACTSGEVVDGPASGTGNTTGGQGTGNTTGGVAGTTGTGNTTGQGRGGTTGVGNTTGQAGRGGTTGTGNTTGQAGTTGTGNITGQAGTTGSGGSTGVCPSTFAVAANGFVQAPVAGGNCWHGYAFAGKGMTDTESMITPADFATCGTPCSLTMMGKVGSATMANSYAGVAFIGFNVGQDSTGGTPTTMTPTGSSVTVTFSASTGGLPLRAQLNGASGSWCYTITGASPATIPYASFNSACWDGSGTAYAKTPIQSFQLVVPGAATPTSGVSVTLTKVTEN